MTTIPFSLYADPRENTAFIHTICQVTEVISALLELLVESGGWEVTLGVGGEERKC